MRVMRYIETFVGIGLSFGPFLGASVYGYIGYANTMYLFSSLNVLALALCMLNLPNLLNKTDQKPKEVSSY